MLELPNGETCYETLNLEVVGLTCTQTEAETQSQRSTEYIHYSYIYVWSSVPNLPMPTSSGKEQFSAAPPSNEHIIDTSRTLQVQKNVCRPVTAPIGHVASNTITK